MIFISDLYSNFSVLIVFAYFINLMCLLLSFDRINKNTNEKSYLLRNHGCFYSK